MTVIAEIKLKQWTWDNRFMAMAKVVSHWSKDPKHKVGAVLVSPNRRTFHSGHNGFPGGLDDRGAQDETMRKTYTVHAELNAILNARANLEGYTLYVTKRPCHSCAKAIAQAGVVRVVFPAVDLDKVSTNWAESQKVSEQLFETLNIEYVGI